MRCNTNNLFYNSGLHKQGVRKGDFFYIFFYYIKLSVIIDKAQLSTMSILSIKNIDIDKRYYR